MAAKMITAERLGAEYGVDDLETMPFKKTQHKRKLRMRSKIPQIEREMHQDSGISRLGQGKSENDENHEFLPT